MIDIEKKKRYATYAMNFLSFVAISMVNTQMIPFMTSIGYDVIQRGYILAANSIVAIAGQFLFGYLCDRFSQMKKFFFLAYTILFISGILMFLKTEQFFIYHLLTIAVMGGMVKVIMGLNETWMLELDPENYGKLRAWGALGLTAGSPLAGFLVRRYSYISLMITLIAVSLFLYGLIMYSPDVKKESRERISLSSIQDLIKNLRYVWLVIIYLLIYMVGTADQYVVIDKMLDIGASNDLVGIKWALQSFMEVPLFLVASKILDRFKPGTLLFFGTFMYGIKFLLYGISYEGWMVTATAALQLVTLPIVMLTSKVMIKEITPQKLQSSAQMFAMAVFIGVSGLITPLITSYLSENIGYDHTLYGVAAFTLLPLALIFLYLKTSKKGLAK